MKIAMLTTDNRQADRSHFLPSPYFGTAPAALMEGLAALPETELHVVSCTQKPMSSPHKLAENIWFHSLHVPKLGWLRTGYSGCIYSSQRLLAEIRPDIVHAQGTERDCAITAAFFRGPKVLTIHGNCRAIAQIYRAKPLSYWWLQGHLERLVIPRFNEVVCISRYTQQWVSGLAKKSCLIPNAVDPKFFEIQPERTPTPPAVLVVANVEARKNQIALIHSLDALSKELPFQVRFFGKCGEDSYSREFRALVQNRAWCFWGGMLDRESLRDEFARSAVLMLPTWEDNCPMVVLEAQAAGVPVIASNVGGVPDLIQDGHTGVLTDPTRPETMSKALARLLKDPHLSRRLAHEGKSHAKAQFHPKVIAEKHLQLYRKVLAAN
jgi:glycosyltransferase involved in cell wall biosynthesis